MNRLWLFLIFMAAFSAIYQVGSMSIVSTDDATKFLEEFEEIIEDIDGLGIFAHNATIGLPMFIPGFGLIWGLFSAFSTGYAIASFTTIAPELAEIPPLAILYMTPFGLMELASYSLGTSRSYILLLRIIRKRALRSEILPTLLEICLMLGLLLAGGLIEYQMLALTELDVGDIP